MADEFTRPTTPPPPIFLGQKERDLVKQINDELLERVIGQPILYIPISVEHTNFHPIYGQAMQKTYLPPVRVFCLVAWEGLETTLKGGKFEKTPAITIHFHKRRLTEDQNLFVREGDFVLYSSTVYEIVKLNEPKVIFGQQEHKMEIEAKCVKARKSNIDLSGVAI